MKNIEYIQGEKELLDLVQPLWEKLNKYHETNSTFFLNKYESFTFEVRKNKFLKEEISSINIDLVKDQEKDLYVGYCISTVNKDSVGEIDSLYLDEEYRKFGIGEELMNRAIVWLKSSQVKIKIISVAAGNESIIGFYEKFGFHERRIILEQICE